MSTERKDQLFVFPPPQLQEVFASMELRKSLLLQKIGNPITSSEVPKTPIIKFVPVEAAVSLIVEDKDLYCRKLQSQFNIKGVSNQMSSTEYKLGLDSFVFSWYGDSVHEYDIFPGKSKWVALILNQKRILSRSYFTYYDLTLWAGLFSEWGSPPVAALNSMIKTWKDTFLPADVLPILELYVSQKNDFDGRLPLPTIDGKEHYGPEIKTPFSLSKEDVRGIVVFCENSLKALYSAGINPNIILPLFQELDLNQIVQYFS